MNETTITSPHAKGKSPWRIGLASGDADMGGASAATRTDARAATPVNVKDVLKQRFQSTSDDRDRQTYARAINILEAFDSSPNKLPFSYEQSCAIANGLVNLYLGRMSATIEGLDAQLLTHPKVRGKVGMTSQMQLADEVRLVSLELAKLEAMQRALDYILTLSGVDAATISICRALKEKGWIQHAMSVEVRLLDLLQSARTPDLESVQQVNATPLTSQPESAT